MKESDNQYELIAKELTSDNGLKDSEELQQLLSENNTLKKIYRKLESFWMNYFPSTKSHNIIEKTEKKLDFTYQINPRSNVNLWYKIATSVFFIISIVFAFFLFMQPKENIQHSECIRFPDEAKIVQKNDQTTKGLGTSFSLTRYAREKKQEFRNLKFTAELEKEPLEIILHLRNEGKDFKYNSTCKGIIISSLKCRKVT